MNINGGVIYIKASPKKVAKILEETPPHFRQAKITLS